MKKIRENNEIHKNGNKNEESQKLFDQISKINKFIARLGKKKKKRERKLPVSYIIKA